MRTERLSIYCGLCLLLWPQVFQAQPGMLDPLFNGTGHVVRPVNESDVTEKILVQPDQKILVIGMSWDATFTARAYVFRYLPDGTPDRDFATDGVFIFQLDSEALFYSAVLTAERKILLVGGTTDHRTDHMLLVQLNEDGTPDGSFGTHGVVTQSVSLAAASAEDMVYDVALDGQGNILVCGNSDDKHLVRRPVVVRFTPTGELDSTFGTDGVATIPASRLGASSFQGIVVQPDGKIVATGYFGQTERRYLLLVVRFNADGSLDSTFSDDGIVKHNHGHVDDEADDIKLTPDGSILVAGFTATPSYKFSALLLKFTPEGELDPAFGTAGAVEEQQGDYGYAYNLAVQADGGIIMSGSSGERPPGAFDLTVWKYMADGTPDPAFGHNGVAKQAIQGYSTKVYTMDVQADGKILVGGQARTTARTNFFFMARLENNITSGVRDVTVSPVARVIPNPVMTGSPVTLQFAEPIRSGARISLDAADGRHVCTYQGRQLDGHAGRVSLYLPASLTPGVYQLVLQQEGARLSSTVLITELTP